MHAQDCFHGRQITTPHRQLESRKCLAEILVNPGPESVHAAKLEGRFLIALIRGRAKLLRCFLIFLRHFVPMKVTHTKYLFRLSVTLVSESS